MGLEMIMLSEVSQTEKDKCMILPIRGIFKNDTNEFIDKTDIDSQAWKTTYGCRRGRGKGRENRLASVLCT